MSTDRDWQRWGEVDPYYAVSTFPQFRSPMSAAAKDEFFRSGEAYCEHLFAVLRTLAPNFIPSSALDFGCGAGRIAIPLAKRCAVTAVDVSDAMLEESRRNAAERGVQLRLARGADGVFDLIHSHAVFQHIAVHRGMLITEQLLSRLLSPGIAVLHYPYHFDGPAARKALHWLRLQIPMAHNIANLIQGRRLREPPMQMNRYDLSALMWLFARSAIKSVYAEHAISTPHVGCVFYLLK